MHFGLPGGVQFFIDMFAITFFVFMVGRIGAVELAATNVAISVDTLAFLPMIGMHIAASIMVGQAMGAGEPDRAAYATVSVLHMALAYMASMALVFLLFPEWLMELFRTRGDAGGAEFNAVVETGVVLLRFVAVFTVIDAVAIVFMGGLKGAGDTRFTMLTMGLASLVCIVIPLSIMSWLGVASIYGLWVCLLTYVAVLAATFSIRFLKGPWRSLRVLGDEA